MTQGQGRGRARVISLTPEGETVADILLERDRLRRQVADLTSELAVRDVTIAGLKAQVDRTENHLLRTSSQLVKAEDEQVALGRRILELVKRP